MLIPYPKNKNLMHALKKKSSPVELKLLLFIPQLLQYARFCCIHPMLCLTHTHTHTHTPLSKYLP